MRHRLVVLAGVVVAIVALLSPAVATAEYPLYGAGYTLTAALSGTVQPAGGDEDGFGFAQVTVDPVNGQVCFRLWASNITEGTAAHIHQGYYGESGPVVVPFAAPYGGFASGCAEVDAEIIDGILADPWGYYVNVHNPDFPAGAIRGQLQPLGG